MKLFYEVRNERLYAGPICDHPFPMHVHAAVEIVRLNQGTAQLSVNGQRYTLAPGDTLAMFPSVAHSYDLVSEDALGLCVIFTPETILEFSNTFRSMRPVSPLLRADQCPAGLKEAADKLEEVGKEPASPLLRASIHMFLAHLMAAMPLEPMERQVNTSLVQQVIQYVSEHFDEPLTLDSLSETLNISKSHLSRLFSEQLNINFRKYINILRVDQACAMLKSTDMTVTEIGYACGFNTLRTFHRAFMDEMHMQPNEYREKKWA